MADESAPTSGRFDEEEAEPLREKSLVRFDLSRQTKEEDRTTCDEDHAPNHRGRAMSWNRSRWGIQPANAPHGVVKPGIDEAEALLPAEAEVLAAEEVAAETAVAAEAAAAAKKSGRSWKALRLHELQEILTEECGMDVAPDAPLMDAGIDSISAVSFLGKLSDHIGVELPETLMFDFPTLRCAAPQRVPPACAAAFAAPDRENAYTALS